MRNILTQFLILFLGLMILGSPGYSATQIPSGCQRKASDIEGILNSIGKSYRDLGQKLPHSLVLGESAQITQDKSLSRNIFAELFAHPEPHFIGILPGTGLGFVTDEKTYIYVCIDLKGNQRSNEVQLYFLAGPDLLDGKFHFSPLKLELAPIDQVDNYLTNFLELTGIGTLERLIGRHSYPQLFSLFRHVIGAGIAELVIHPQTLKAYPATEVLGITESVSAPIPIKYDSRHWMYVN